MLCAVETPPRLRRCGQARTPRPFPRRVPADAGRRCALRSQCRRPVLATMAACGGEGTSRRQHTLKEGADRGPGNASQATKHPRRWRTCDAGPRPREGTSAKRTRSIRSGAPAGAAQGASPGTAGDRDRGCAQDGARDGRDAVTGVGPCRARLVRGHGGYGGRASRRKRDARSREALESRRFRLRVGRSRAAVD